MTDGQITNKDLYEAQRDIAKQLGSLALQVATLVGEWRGVGERLEAGSAKMADFETRLRVLEQWRWRMAGGSALAGLAGGGAAGSLLSWLLARH